MPDLKINADFSHWCCVSESLLENQQATVQLAISRAHHFHARIGHAKGPQIREPRDDYWQREKDQFADWWQQTVMAKQKENTPLLTISLKFIPPPPYQWIEPVNEKAPADIFEMNVYMMHWLKTKLITIL
jgi:hypothetical protein